MGYLSVMNPESDLRFSFGDSDLYRKACARMIAEEPADVDYRESVIPMLECLEIPSSITKLPNECFYDCDGIKEIKIPNHIKEIRKITY